MRNIAAFAFFLLALIAAAVLAFLLAFFLTLILVSLTG
jgi:hypothetical protein